MRKLILILPLAIIGLFFFTGCSTADNPKPSFTAGPGVTLDGTWKADVFEATIADDTIVINVVDSGAKSLYWKGTFPEGEDSVVKSVADTEALEMSILGSQDTEKVFTTKGDTIAFDFTMMGTTKTVALKRS